MFVPSESGAPAPLPAMFNWVRVRGRVTTNSDEDDPSHRVQHNILVFAQVEGLDRQAIATQGEINSVNFNTREDACDTGCLAACERASLSAMADDALDKCIGACENACVMPDAKGKFSAVVCGEKGNGKGGPGPLGESAKQVRAKKRGRRRP